MTSYNTATPNLSTPQASEILNQVEYLYNARSQLTEFRQQHDGQTDTNSWALEFTYDTEDASGGGGNYVRIEKMTYNDGGELTYGYGPSGSVNDRISRLETYALEGLPDNLAEYDYLGASVLAVLDYADIDVQLDRTAALDGRRQSSGQTDLPGEYPAFDRFARLIKHMWVDGDYTTTAGSDPNRPQIVAHERAFNKQGVLISYDNVNPAWSDWDHKNAEFDHDDLLRLIKAWRGERTAGTVGDFNKSNFTFDPESQEWDLSVLGNWTAWLNNPTTGGTFNQEDRTHNDINELTDRDPDGSGGNAPIDVTYDANGNVRLQYVDADDAWRYTHDAWNMLVEVEFVEDVDGTPTVNDVAEYEYNGMNQRIVKRSDIDASSSSGGPDDTLDQQRVMYYSPDWRLLEEVVDDDIPAADGDERIVQYLWGHTYIDDILFRRESTDVTNPDPTTDFTTERYYCTDEQYSVVEILDDAAAAVERVRYSPYGKPRHHPWADSTGDGTVNVDDLLNVQNNWNNFGYGDTNRDGIVNVTDNLAVINEWGAGEEAGVLSLAAEDNILGFSSYVWNIETRQYHVRNRVYDTTLGRWLERDPLGYVDGMNLYQYVRGMPLIAGDPTGEIIPLIIGGAIIGGLFGGAAGGIATDWEWSGIGKGALYGGLAGAFTGPIFGGLGGLLGPSLAGTIASGAMAGGIEAIVFEIMWLQGSGIPVTWERIRRALMAGTIGGGIGAGLYRIGGAMWNAFKRMRRPIKGGQQSGSPLYRPYLRVSTRKAITDAASRTDDGRFISPNTGDPFDGPFHYGHVYGREYRRILREAQRRGMTQKEFNDWINSHPEWFQIEPPYENMCHRFEKPGVD